MQALLTITDEDIGTPKKTCSVLTINKTEVTLRELIEMRVREEAQRFAETSEEVFRGLVQPNDTEWRVNGYAFKTPRPRKVIDVEAQVALAIKAFESNGFFVLVGTKQIENLSDTIRLDETSEISFIRLMPLIGG